LSGLPRIRNGIAERLMTIVRRTAEERTPNSDVDVVDNAQC
jgi:hypothetical protein